MITLRLFIHSEDFDNISWQVDEKGVANAYNGTIAQALEVEFTTIEVYLAPVLANVFPIDLSSIGSQKINDELLLNIVEENIADDIENSKPILLKIDDENNFLAILNKKFYNDLIEKLDPVHKKVKFIQPWIFNTYYKEDIWTIYMMEEQAILRTSLYEYYLLDQTSDNKIPDILAFMLSSYTQKEIILYSDHLQLHHLLQDKYHLTIINKVDLNLGEMIWNFYKAKSRRFSLKLSPEYRNQIIKTGQYIAVSLLLFFIIWTINLYVLFWHKHAASKEIAGKLAPITTEKNVTASLINDSMQKIKDMAHKKGVYNDYDLIPLMQEFLTGFNGNTDMILAIKYDNDKLDVFLNSQYKTSDFFVMKNVLIEHMIEMNLQSYDDYNSHEQSPQTASNDNTSTVLDANNSNNDSKMLKITDAAFVITIQKPFYKLI